MQNRHPVPALLLLLFSSAFAQRSSVFNITYYGAKGDGKTVNTLAFRQAIEACVKSGGGTVYVPAGEFVSGTIVLRSRVNLYLEAGAVVKGSDDLADYKIEPADQSGVDPDFEKNFGPRYGLVWANQAENFSITGQGTLDGNGTHFMDLSKKRIEDVRRTRPQSFPTD
jgi:polygalacturonase